MGGFVNNLVIVQVRLGSSRLLDKAVKPILGKPAILHQLQRIKRGRLFDEVVCAIPDGANDDKLQLLLEENGYLCFRGSNDDVLDRYYQAALEFKPKNVIRITGDCPLFDARVMDEVVAVHVEHGNDYTSNIVEPTYPDGMDVEVFTFSILEQAWQQAVLYSEREHVTQYILKNEHKQFKIENVSNDDDLSSYRLTLDYEQDFLLIEKIYKAVYADKPNFSLSDIMHVLEKNSDWLSLNNQFSRNCGMQDSLKKDSLQNRYKKSELLLNRAIKTIPLGSQTFSKSKTHFPQGASPYFIEKGKGSHVWDADGNEYIDFINGLLCISLGYNDADVNAAVQKQMQKGFSFSLATELEIKLAEKICEMVPCAEMLRFGKTGTDVTSAAIRLARAYTGKDHVLVCGYHGWQDWYIGSTSRSLGVPEATKSLTHVFEYNDIASLEKYFALYPEQVAAVILEPMNTQYPRDNFLHKVKQITAKNSAVLIFDEIITGFRFAKGGAQEYFGVTPDLTTMGKGMANGLPISVVCGRADIMCLMEEIFFSGTFFGETLSMAAAYEVLTKITKQSVLEHITDMGQRIITGVTSLIKKHGLTELLSISGHPAWSFLNFSAGDGFSLWEIKTLFMQEMLLRGILISNTHNMSYAHSDADIAALMTAYDEVFAYMNTVIGERSLQKHINCEILKPLFSVR